LASASAGAAGENTGLPSWGANPHVVFRAERQEPFQPGAGVLWTLALIPMGQEHYEIAWLPPFVSELAMKIIDYHLRAVGEIAELRFPDHKAERVGNTVTEFKSQDGRLRQGAVENLKRRLVRMYVFQGTTHCRFHITQYQVALAEGSRALSCPLRRTGVPSKIRVPKAKASA